MANQTTRMLNMETVRRQCGDFMVNLVCRLSLVFMEKTWQIKLPDNLHTDFIIKPSFRKHSP